MVVTLLFFDGCPNWQITDARLEALSAEFGFDRVERFVEAGGAGEVPGMNEHVGEDELPSLMLSHAATGSVSSPRRARIEASVSAAGRR